MIIEMMSDHDYIEMISDHDHIEMISDHDHVEMIVRFIMIHIKITSR